MTKEIPTRKKGVVAYDQNPFWKETSVKIGSKMVRVSGGHHVSDDGESIGISGVHVVKEVDESEFLKLYTGNIKSIFALKPTSQKVLQFLMTELQKTPNADSIYLAWFSADSYFSEHDIKVSRSSFQRSLLELLEKGFIAESPNPNMFWFNPNLFFNGSRMTFIHEYRKTGTTKGLNSDTSTVNFIEGETDGE